MTEDLFQGPAFAGQRERLGPQACVLRGLALPFAQSLLSEIEAITRAAPFRHMMTPGGFTMSVAMTNCGRLGWITDRRGYRYATDDPQTARPWPAMPAVFASRAQRAAQAVGFADFEPDACLVNRYLAGNRLTLHQDSDEVDFSAPIVSVSLGMQAIFLFGGHKRSDRTARVPVFHGDVVVWGGVDRKRYHGVLPLKESMHPLLGTQRLNLTFRKAG